MVFFFLFFPFFFLQGDNVDSVCIPYSMSAEEEAMDRILYLKSYLMDYEKRKLEGGRDRIYE